MKLTFFLIFLAACATKNPNWDSGSKKTQSAVQEQRQEQQNHTRDQFPNTNSAEPF